MRRILVVLIGILMISGCTTTGNQTAAKRDFYSGFTGKNVTSVTTIFPSGDVPHDAVKMSDGTFKVH